MPSASPSTSTHTRAGACALFHLTGEMKGTACDSLLSARLAPGFRSGLTQILVRVTPQGTLCGNAAWLGVVQALPDGAVLLALPDGSVKRFKRGEVVAFDLERPPG